MKLQRLDAFIRLYAKLPVDVRKKVDRRIGYLAQNLRHPGVKAKKMTGVGDIWEGRVNGGYRFTFQIEGDTIVLRKVGTHVVLKNP
jgi:mRNA-degrading endonuclease RelE of RelBE toxin-antitoxin system